MIKLYCILFTLAILLLVGCKNPKISTNNQKIKNTTGILTEENHLESGSITDIYKFSISFISIGGGINESLKDKYDQFIHDFSTKSTVKLDYEVIHWGKEGETDYCFKLSELTPKEQDQFMSDSRLILKESNLVNIEENVPCRHKK